MIVVGHNSRPISRRRCQPAEEEEEKFRTGVIGVVKPSSGAKRGHSNKFIRTISISIDLILLSGGFLNFIWNRIMLSNVKN